MTMPTSPFDLRIMKLDANRVARLPRVTTSEVYEGGNNLHPNGLFSTISFGPQGSKQRDYTFGVIKLNTKIIHPHIYRIVRTLKSDYEKIIKGEKQAIWDAKQKDFVIVEDGNGESGYHFFVSHLHELNPPKTSSVKRQTKIKVLNKYRDALTTEYVLVLPAGLRDLMIDKDGKTSMDEVNELYQYLINYANSLEGTSNAQGPEIDNLRLSMQYKFNEIYDYYTNLMTGKKGFLLQKWGGRNIHDSARNVISSQDASADILGDESAPTIDTVQIGIHQYMVSNRPTMIHLIRSFEVHQRVFYSGTNMVSVIDPASGKRKEIEVDDAEVDGWNTIEGLTTKIEQFGKDSVKNRAVTLRGCYFAFVYEMDGGFDIVYSIDELPDGVDKKALRPMTFIEFYYLAGAKQFNSGNVQFTRYPVTGDGSIFIGDCYVKTTIPSKRLYRISEGAESIYREYPDVKSTSYITTTRVHSTRLDGLGGDFDGDKGSTNPVYTEEAKQEINKVRNRRSSIVGVGGKLHYDIDGKFEVVLRATYAMTQPMGDVRSVRED